MEGKTGKTRIEKIVYGGMGLAWFEDMTLFLPYTSAGDTVEFIVTRKKKNCLFGEITNVVEASPARREAQCPVFGRCGGCHFLHLDYEEETRIKKETFRSTLGRIGKIDTEIASFTPCPERFGYRNHALFKVGSGGVAGFSKRESSEIVPFPEQGCLLLPPEMREAISALDPEALTPGTKIRSRLDSFGAVHFWGVEGMISPPDILMKAGDLSFSVYPEAFFQINRYLNDSLMKLAVSLPTQTAQKFLDIYCGVGFFTLPMARRAIEAVGIEVQRQAHKNAVASARLNKVANVKFIRETAERGFSRIGGADLVLTDPPRAGIPASVMKSIIKLRPREIIMISCDAPTFARDAARLVEAQWTPSEIHLIDMFPGTYHVESVALFKRD
jgi:23S rRNA (uracil1939-C5)-methyltransferase